MKHFLFFKVFKQYPKLLGGIGLFIATFGTLFYPAYQYMNKQYFQNLPPPVQSKTTSSNFGGNSLHARSQKMESLFNSANILLTSAISKVEAVQHADQLPDFATEMQRYKGQFIYYGEGMPWASGIGYRNFFARGTLSCERDLENLSWLGKDMRTAFAAGEKPRLLDELRQKVAQLTSTQATCVAAAPHYHGDDDNKWLDRINGDYARAVVSAEAPSGTYFSIFIQTTLRTDEVQLLGLAPADSADLQAQALALIAKHCQAGLALSVVELVPSSRRAQLKLGGDVMLVRSVRRGGGVRSHIDSPYAAGQVWCGSYNLNVGAELLRAGFATIDFTQVLNPKITSATGSSITVDNYPDYFAALNEARQARRGIWAQAKNI